MEDPSRVVTEETVIFKYLTQELEISPSETALKKRHRFS